MASRKGQHKSDKEQYTAYASLLKRIANRKARLARHLKQHPNDAQALTASSVEGSPREKATTKGNFPAKKYFVYDGAGQKTLIGSFDPTTRDNK